ncbi:hypothetical protein GCM10027203_79730 [Nonomuraea fastidiosa]
MACGAEQSLKNCVRGRACLASLCNAGKPLTVPLGGADEEAAKQTSRHHQQNTYRPLRDINYRFQAY